MKKNVVTIYTILVACLISPLANAGDKSIMFEFGFGFGDSGKTAHTKDEQKGLDLSKCRNRNTGSMKFMALRLQSDDIELHGAKWSHDEKIAKCDRDSYAVGLGYVFSTEDNGTAGRDNIYASLTPGIAYTWGKNKNFTGQTNDNTNYRLANNWQMFNRLAVGTGNDNAMIEVAVNHYGLFEDHHGESFVTLGVGLRDLENNDPIQSTRSDDDDSGNDNNDDNDHGNDNDSGNDNNDDNDHGNDNDNNDDNGNDNDDGGDGDNDDGDNGHGNDDDGFDESNPGKSKGKRIK